MYHQTHFVKDRFQNKGLNANFINKLLLKRQNMLLIL